MLKVIKWAQTMFEAMGINAPKLRQLKPSEYGRLKGLRGSGLPDNDEWIPDPKFSTVIIAEKKGEIVGFWVIQEMVHVDPVWTKEDYRGNLTWRMWNKVKGLIGDGPVYVFLEPTHSGWEKKKTAIKHLGFTYVGQLYVRKGDK